MLHRYVGELPPGFEGYPLLYMATVFSLLLANILTLEWIWRLSWAIHEKPYDLRHPATAMRAVLMLLLLGAIMRSGPDTWLLVRWSDISPLERLSLLIFDGYMDSVSFLPFSLAWLVAWLASPMVNYQLDRKPTPLHLWPTRDQIRRPLKIGVGVLVISFALTFFP